MAPGAREARSKTIIHAQRGAISRSQAYECKFSRAMIWRRLDSGQWHRLTDDVFLVDGFPRTWQQRAVAATLIHPAASLSHSTSATWRGLDGFKPGRVEVVVPPTGSHAAGFATVHRSRHVQFELVDGVRTTTFAQTLVQLAGVVGDERLQSALHSGVHADPRRLDQVIQRITELRGRRLPGLRRLEEAVAALSGEPPTASELERYLFSVLGEVPGLPEVRRQVPFEWSDVHCVTDAFVPAWSLILEADGRAWHTRVQDFDRDRWRDAEAAIHGLHVMRFGWRRLRDDRAGVIDQVTRFGRSRTDEAA